MPWTIDFTDYYLSFDWHVLIDHRRQQRIYHHKLTTIIFMKLKHEFHNFVFSRATFIEYTLSTPSEVRSERLMDEVNGTVFLHCHLIKYRWTTIIISIGVKMKAALFFKSKYEHFRHLFVHSVWRDRGNLVTDILKCHEMGDKPKSHLAPTKLLNYGKLNRFYSVLGEFGANLFPDLRRARHFIYNFIIL